MWWADNSVKSWCNLPICNSNQIATISMHITSLVKIHWHLLKLSSQNENTDVWRADNSVWNWQNFAISNLKPDLYNINRHTTFGEHGNKNMDMWQESTDIYSSYHPEMKIQMCGGQITLSKIDKFCPLAIPNQISTISINAHTKFGENPLMFKLSSSNEIWMDGQTAYIRWMDRWTDRGMDRHMDFQQETIIPHQYCVAGYNKQKYKRLMFDKLVHTAMNFCSQRK